MYCFIIFSLQKQLVVFVISLIIMYTLIHINKVCLDVKKKKCRKPLPVYHASNLRLVIYQLNKVINVIFCMDDPTVVLNLRKFCLGLIHLIFLKNIINI